MRHISTQRELDTLIPTVNMPRLEGAGDLDLSIVDSAYAMTDIGIGEVAELICQTGQ